MGKTLKNLAEIILKIFCLNKNKIVANKNKSNKMRRNRWGFPTAGR